MPRGRNPKAFPAGGAYQKERFLTATQTTLNTVKISGIPGFVVAVPTAAVELITPEPLVYCPRF
jgi:hypothetical protein